MPLRLTHPRHEKTWGYEDWIHNDERYCGKHLVIASGFNCSFHYHKLKDEVLYVNSGIINFYYAYPCDTEIKVIELQPGMSFHVEPGLIHQMYAIREAHIFEFSTHHFDTDSYRLTRDKVEIGPCPKIDISKATN